MLAMGTGDPLEKAELESARAALLRDLGRPREPRQAGAPGAAAAHRAGGPQEPLTRHGPGRLPSRPAARAAGVDPGVPAAAALRPGRFVAGWASCPPILTLGPSPGGRGRAAITR